jgi:glycosyltransferase involved in cell wall biosynthesis
MRTRLSRWCRSWFSENAEAVPEVVMEGPRDAPRILIFTEHLNATYFISFDIPLRRLHARGAVSFAAASQRHVEASGHECWKHWSEQFQPDVVIFTRYGQENGMAIRKHFQELGIPVVYHIDDDLLDIPDSLGTEIRQRHGNSSVVSTRHALLASADLIYASTEHLSSILHSRFPRQQFFQGIYAPYIGDLLSSQAPNAKAARNGLVVGYMGSKGHQHDLDLAVPAIEQLLDERPDLSFEVFGTIAMPQRLERFGERIRSYSVQRSYIDFLGTLAGLGWDIGLAPLVNEPFNHCKAPTKFIEYTAAGIPVIASDLPVYRNAVPAGGGLLVAPEAWYAALSAWLDAPVARSLALEAAQRHCSVTYAPEVLERQLLTLLSKVHALPPSN